MKKPIYILSTILLLASMSCWGQQPHKWLHIYQNGQNFNSYKIDDIQSIHHKSVDQWSASLRIATSHGTEILPLSQIENCEIGKNVPTIYLTLTDYPEYNELREKDTYLNATISIDGNGILPDLEPKAVSIKGRGNSTWWFRKKPYRLKFDKKTAILGFEKAKSYALIANYIDCTLLRNAIALKTAQLLGMPYTNHAQPVRVYLNGICKGAYMLTEKIGISSTSVNIDENTGILFELDSNYDEPYKFRSSIYNLPVMVKDPDLDERAKVEGVTANQILNKWRDNFNSLMDKVQSNKWVDGVDLDLASLVDYVLVYNLTGNRELSWPKSTYMYKTSIDSPYFFGPVWDFDWAYTYDENDNLPANRVLLSPWSPLVGEPFFRKLCSSNQFKNAYAARWQQFVDEMLPQLWTYIDEYAEWIRPSAKENGVLWPKEDGVTLGSFDFDENVAYLKDWIQQRINYISNHANWGLYE